MRLLDFSLNRLVEESGDLLNCLILHCLLAIRAFHCKAVDIGGECLQLSFLLARQSDGMITLTPG